MKLVEDANGITSIGAADAINRQRLHYFGEIVELKRKKHTLTTQKMCVL